MGLRREKQRETSWGDLGKNVRWRKRVESKTSGEKGKEDDVGGDSGRRSSERSEGLREKAMKLARVACGRAGTG